MPNMHWLPISLCLVAAGIAIASELARRRRLAPILTRSSAENDWLRNFPDAPEAEIRTFLKIFGDAFALRSRHDLKFRPSDRIMDVYHAIYPPKWTLADAMELEIFALLLKRRYGISLQLTWRDDLTLGEIFNQTRSP
jgi:hypothetical protein